MNKSKIRVIERKRRAFRVRKKIEGTTDRPRLCVRRSINHIYAQLVDDIKGETIAQVTSYGKSFSESKNSGGNLSKTEIAKAVGEAIAQIAVEKGISSVVFDRKGYLYHGRVKALAEAARSKGLVF